MTDPLEFGTAVKEPRYSTMGPSQGWGLAALVLGGIEILASGLGHLIAWQYIELGRTYMSDVDSRLGLGMTVCQVATVLGLAVLGVVAGGLGVRESRRLESGRGLAVVGLTAAIA